MNLLKKLFNKKEKNFSLAEIEKNCLKAKEYFEQGMSAENIDQAIELYQKAIELNPNDTLTYVNMAKAYYTKGNFDQVEFDIKRRYFRESMKAAQEILQLSSNNDEQLMANILIQANAFFLGDFETSLTALDNDAIHLDRNSRDAIIMLVNVWTQIKNATNYMLEKGENEFTVTYPGGAVLTTLTIQQVIDLLAKLKDIEDVYSIRPEVEDLLTKLVALELVFIEEEKKKL